MKSPGQIAFEAYWGITHGFSRWPRVSASTAAKWERVARAVLQYGPYKTDLRPTSGIAHEPPTWGGLGK